MSFRCKQSDLAFVYIVGCDCCSEPGQHPAPSTQHPAPSAPRPAPRARPGGPPPGSPPRRPSRPEPRAPPRRLLAASSPRRSLGSPSSAPRAPSAAPGSARRGPGGPGEEPENPTEANQVSEPLLLGTNITRDELFLPDNPVSLTARLSPEEKRGRCHLDPAEAFPGGFLRMPHRGCPSAVARSW